MLFWGTAKTRPKMNTINGLPIPRLLLALMQQGQWRHPGDAVLREIIPFFREPVDFIANIEEMSQESSGHLEDTEEDLFHERRSSKDPRARALPWRDLDQSFLIAVNREPGDDIAIALDFRSAVEDPQVVANNWHTGIRGCVWQLVSPTFSDFVRRCGLGKGKG
jgi:hypothetical protein